VTITLRLEGGASHSRTVRTALPTTDKQLWIKLLHLDLEAHPPQASILAVALHAEPGSTGKVQSGLFSPQLPEAASLDVTLAPSAPSSVKGMSAVLYSKIAMRRSVFAWRPLPCLRTALPWLFRRSSESLYGSFGRRKQPPSGYKAHDQHSSSFAKNYTVEHAYGPWLAEGDWWNQTLWGWEQWDLVARAEDGSLLSCCLMRDLLHDQWQMAALYD
jgi:protein ImuB